MQGMGQAAARGERQLANCTASCVYRVSHPVPHRDAGESGPAGLPKGENDTPGAQCSKFLLSLCMSVDDPFLMHCLLYTSPSPRDATLSRMPSSA